MAKAKAKAKTKAKAKPKAKPAKAKPAKQATKKAATKQAAAAKAKAKPAKKATSAARPRGKVVSEPKGGLVAKARAATEALVARAKAATEAIVAKVKRDAPAADHRHTTPGMEPFQLTETSPGKYSLLLTTFDAAAPAFSAIGIDGGGYAWEGVARHIITTDDAALANRISFDPEASMFCAYGDDRAGLEDLGKRLSSLFHDVAKLTELVQAIGPDGFED
jgi:hypothetical protein